MIGEGESEVTLLSSKMFRAVLAAMNISYVPRVVDMKGKGNLENRKLEGSINRLTEEGATHILILTDKDDAECFTSVKEKIFPTVPANVLIIIPQKELETWFIACHTTMTKITGKAFAAGNPENIDNPFKYILTEINRDRKRRISYSKPALTKKFLEKDFKITSAATHPNCPSAKYFLDKLTALGSKK